LGGFLLAAPAGENVYTLADASSQFTDFYAEVTTTIQSGARNDGGDVALVLRLDSAEDCYIYSFDAQGNWHFYLSPATASSATELAHGMNSALRTGDGTQNILAIKAQGATFTLYANNQQIGSVTDSTFSTGEVGLEVDGGDSQSVSALFTNLHVWAA
jgi:hypothetical protein